MCDGVLARPARKGRYRNMSPLTLGRLALRALQKRQIAGMEPDLGRPTRGTRPAGSFDNRGQSVQGFVSGPARRRTTVGWLRRQMVRPVAIEIPEEP
jgi:hypothetical protein